MSLWNDRKSRWEQDNTVTIIHQYRPGITEFTFDFAERFDLWIRSTDKVPDQAEVEFYKEKVLRACEVAIEFIHDEIKPVNNTDDECTRDKSSGDEYDRPDISGNDYSKADIEKLVEILSAEFDDVWVPPTFPPFATKATIEEVTFTFYSPAYYKALENEETRYQTHYNSSGMAKISTSSEPQPRVAMRLHLEYGGFPDQVSATLFHILLNPWSSMTLINFSLIIELSFQR